MPENNNNTVTITSPLLLRGEQSILLAAQLGVESYLSATQGPFYTELRPWSRDLRAQQYYSEVISGTAHSATGEREVWNLHIIHETLSYDFT